MAAASIAPTFSCSATWVAGCKAGSRVLIEPEGFRMKFKNTVGNMKYFACLKQKELGCKVFLTLDVAQDKVLEVRGIHCHDNNLLKEEVKKVVDEKVETIGNQPYVSPRLLSWTLLNTFLATSLLRIV